METTCDFKSYCTMETVKTAHNTRYDIDKAHLITCVKYTNRNKVQQNKTSYDNVTEQTRGALDNAGKKHNYYYDHN